MINSELSLLDNGYYALMSVAFLYICTNPFNCCYSFCVGLTAFQMWQSLETRGPIFKISQDFRKFFLSSS